MPALKRPAATNPGLATAGSPYNSADEPANVALKATKARRARPEPPAQFDDEVLAAADDAGAAVAAQELAGPPPSRGRRIAWISGIAALGVVLGAQAIHHNRNDLATSARFNRPLTRFYAAIGVPLVPNWDLTQYEVRQLGASTRRGRERQSHRARQPQERGKPTSATAVPAHHRAGPLRQPHRHARRAASGLHAGRRAGRRATGRRPAHRRGDDASRIRGAMPSVSK